MKRRIAFTVLAGAVITVLLAVVATSGSVPLAERAPSMPFDLPEFDLSQVTPTTEPTEPGGAPREQGPSRGSNVIAFLQNILILGAIALIGLGLRRAWQHRPQLEWRPTRRPDDFVLLEEAAATMTADAAAQRAALERGEARNAIVACWSRLEHLVAGAGFDRNPADTAAEFTLRVLSRYPIDPTAINDLSGLYREARFSTHAMGEPERAAALVALDAIHDGLRDAADRTLTK